MANEKQSQIMQRIKEYYQNNEVDLIVGERVQEISTGDIGTVNLKYFSGKHFGVDIDMYFIGVERDNGRGTYGIDIDKRWKVIRTIKIGTREIKKTYSERRKENENK